MAIYANGIKQTGGSSCDLPVGGLTGQILAKKSEVDGDLEWKDAESLKGEKGEAGEKGEKGDKGDGGDIAITPFHPLGLTKISEMRAIPESIPEIPREYFNHRYWALAYKATTDSFRLVVSDTSEIIIKEKADGEISAPSSDALVVASKDGSQVISYTYTNEAWQSEEVLEVASLDDANGILQCNHIIVNTTDDTYIYPQQELIQTTGTTTEIGTYKGKQGQIVINTDDNSIHVMDGVNNGGHKVKTIDMDYTDLATESKNVIGAINEVFQFANDTVNNLQEAYAQAIVGKGGEVAKAGEAYTKDEIVAGIESIEGGSNFPMKTFYYLKGNECENITGGWGIIGQQGSASFIFDKLDETMYLEQKAGTSTGKILGTKNKIDVTNIKYIVFNLKSINERWGSWIGLWDGTNIEYTGLTVRERFHEAGTGDGYYRNVCLDVSEYKGEYHIVLHSSSSSSHTCKTTISSVFGIANYGDAIESPDVSNMQSKYEEAITSKGGTVTKVGAVATLEEILNGILSIPVGSTSTTETFIDEIKDITLKEIDKSTISDSMPSLDSVPIERAIIEFI